MKNSLLSLIAGALISISPVFSQVEIDQPIIMTGPSGSRSVQQLEAPINGTDAANKDYVDNAASASGGGGLPTMISTESAGLIYAQAVNYCSNLTEGGHTDWRIPSADELTSFAGVAGASANFLWTRSLAQGKENPVNQNYISMRLSDGKWRNGGEVTGLFLTRSVNGNTTSTSFTTVATLVPSTPGNVIIPTFITLFGNRSSASPCCANSSVRLVSNFADGSNQVSPTYGLSISNTTVVNLSAIPLLSSVTPLTSIEVQVAAQHSDATTNATLTVTGYEINMTQIDGATLPVRCVR